MIDGCQAVFCQGGDGIKAAGDYNTNAKFCWMALDSDAEPSTYNPFALNQGLHVLTCTIAVDQGDEDGVGQLMQLAVEKGRSVKPDLECGICGEHGGDPESIRICHRMGLTYVSCSPFRVPIARLAAAHAALTEKA